jgi:hypothetical protein
MPIQIPDYGRVNPITMEDLLEQKTRIYGTPQEQQLNQLKIQNAQTEMQRNQELAPIKAQQTQMEYSVNKHNAMKSVATDVKTKVLQIAGQQGIQENTPQFQKIVDQVANAYKPIMESITGKPATNEPADWNGINYLAGSTPAQYHPPVTHAGGIAEWTPQGWRNVEVNGQQLKPGQYDVGTQYGVNKAKAIAQLVQQGHISPQEADSLLGGAQQSQQAKNVPTANWTHEYEKQLIARANQGDQDAINEIESTANGGAYNPIPTATQRKQAESEIEQQSKIPEREQHQATQYQAQSKPFRELSEAYQKTKTLFDKAKDSAPATLAAATAYMKLLDPGSVVRESELGMAVAATGKLDKASNFMNEIKNGKVLTDSQIKEFKAAVEDVYKASKSQQLKLDKHYKETAERNKLNPKNIIQDVGQYGDYKSADELKAAVANGQLDIEEAKDIARMKFGME